VKKSNKKFKAFSCHHNPLQSALHSSEIMLENYSVSNKPLKSGYSFTT